MEKIVDTKVLKCNFFYSIHIEFHIEKTVAPGRLYDDKRCLIKRKSEQQYKKNKKIL
jgi:hypothetical protein